MSVDREGAVGTARLETFADGVFAIAITLLVLEIHIPEAGEPVGRTLLEQWPSFLAYVTSFLTIGIMWLNHHRIFTVVRATTSGFLFVNIVFLMPIAFLPYPTAVVARHLTEPDGRLVATFLYGGTMVVIAVLFSALWAYASSRGLLASDVELSPVWQRRGQLVYRLAPYLYAGGTLAAVVSPLISLGVFLGLAIYWAFPSASPSR